MMSFHNKHAFLTFHKASLKGVIQDYVINFHEDECDMQLVIAHSSDLFQQLMDTFKDKKVFARLVAKVNFFHFNDAQEIISERSYHFPSFSSEEVIDVSDFFKLHMLKIASRLDSFNSNGSNLLIKNIQHIHMQLSFQ